MWGCGRQRGLCAAHVADQLLDVTTLDADLAQQPIDQRRLRAEAQGRIDDAVGKIAVVPAVMLTLSMAIP